MKKIIAQLEKQLTNLEELIQKREDYVDERSEKWQESEACEEYMDKTQDIDIQVAELYTVIDELKEFL